MIITRTPYRLSFFGGGTDYNPWYEKHGGTIVAAGLAHYCYITVRQLPPFFEHRSRVVYSRTELVQDRNEILHPSVRGCLEYLTIDNGLEIHHDGDLPARSGIGSSSSFTVGLLHALHALQGVVRSAEQLAKEAIEVEQLLLKESCGIQDQVMAAHGGFRVLSMGPGPDWRIRHLPLAKEFIRELESHVLFGFSGISRTAEELAKKKVENIIQGKTDRELLTIQRLASEAVELFTAQAEMKTIGALLDESWQAKRGLAEGLSLDWMDELYQTAKRAGAYGGKLMGAGGGGFFFFLAPPERHDAIRQALPQIKVWVPFKIALTGSQVIFQNGPSQYGQTG